MAEFVSQKENTRRMIILVACVVIDVIALGLGIFAVKKSSDIENGEKEVKTIFASQEAVKLLEDENEKILENTRAFSQPIGWREHAVWSIDRFPTGAVNTPQLTHFLDEWTDRLKATKAVKGDPQSLKYRLLKTIDDLKSQTTASEFITRLDKIRKNVSTKRYKKWEGGNTTDTLTLKDLFLELENLEEVYVDLETAVRERKGVIGEAEKKINSDSEAKLVKALNKLQNTIGILIGSDRDQSDPQDLVEAGGVLKDLQKAEDLAPKEIATRRKKYAEIQSQLEKRASENESYRVQMESRRKDLVSRIEWMKFRQEEARERQDPDGEILAVVSDQQIAYIDLLQKDHLFRGMMFDVYSLEPGGLKIKKGRVEVIQVRGDGSSIVSVLKQSDPSDPIKVGDRIFNEAFDKGKKQYIAFAGTMRSRMSNEELTSIIRQAGDEYQDKVDERTSFVVVGDGYDRDVNFEKAQELGVRLLLERSLFQYLGVK